MVTITKWKLKIKRTIDYFLPCCLKRQNKASVKIVTAHDYDHSLVFVIKLRNSVERSHSIKNDFKGDGQLRSLMT